MDAPGEVRVREDVDPAADLDERNERGLSHGLGLAGRPVGPQHRAAHAEVAVWDVFEDVEHVGQARGGVAARRGRPAAVERRAAGDANPQGFGDPVLVVGPGAESQAGRGLGAVVAIDREAGHPP